MRELVQTLLAYNETNGRFNTQIMGSYGPCLSIRYQPTLAFGEERKKL